LLDAPQVARQTSALRFGWTSCVTIFKEPNFADLLRQHWEEAGLHHDACPLSPDLPRYISLEAMGIFRAWTGYTEEGVLAAYLAFFVQPNLHYSTTLHAIEDLYMVAAPYRRGLTGYRLFATALPELKALGVKRCIVHEKTHLNAERGGLGKLFTRLGFEFTDRLWIKLL
jgi:hypothetical protein